MHKKFESLNRKIMNADNVREARDNGSTGINEACDNSRNYLERKLELARSSEGSNIDKAKAITNLLMAPAMASAAFSMSICIGVSMKLSRRFTQEAETSVTNADIQEDDSINSLGM